jgi:hypothetical protein
MNYNKEEDRDMPALENTVIKIASGEYDFAIPENDGTITDRYVCLFSS